MGPLSLLVSESHYSKNTISHFDVFFFLLSGGGGVCKSQISNSKANNSKTTDRIELKFSPSINRSLGS